MLQPEAISGFQSTLILLIKNAFSASSHDYRSFFLTSLPLGPYPAQTAIKTTVQMQFADLRAFDEPSEVTAWRFGFTVRRFV